MPENQKEIGDSKLVTVLMSVYNGDKFLHQTIQSVLDQSYKHFEFLIVDNGSQDKSLSIIESYKDPRIRVLSLLKSEDCLGH